MGNRREEIPLGLFQLLFSFHVFPKGVICGLKFLHGMREAVRQLVKIVS